MKLGNRYLLSKLLKYVSSMIITILTVFILQHTAYAISFGASYMFPNEDTQIRLHWNVNSDVKYYKIFRNSGGLDIEIKSVNIDSDYIYNEFVDTGLTPSTTYQYTIRGYSNAAMTNEIPLTGNTLNITTYSIIKPYNISSKYDVGTQMVTLSWSGSLAAVDNIVEDDNGNTYSAGSANSYTFHESSIGPVSYSISSSDSFSNNSGSSDLVTVTPIPELQYMISAVAHDGYSVVVWRTFSQINDFHLERSAWDGTAWSNWTTVSVSLSGTSISDFPMDGGSYRYRLAANSSSDYSGSSKISNTVIIPKAPSGLICTIANTTSITLNWINNPGNRSDLWVGRLMTNGNYLTLAKLPYTATSYTDNIAVNNGTTYTYMITAYDNSGNISDSTPVSVTAAIPAAPTGLNLTVISGSAVTLNWTENGPYELGFYVERSDSSGPFVQIDTTGANAATYDDTGLASDHTYTYRVKAFNNLGSSPYSNEVTINMYDFVAPNSLTVNTVSSSQIDLAWTYPGTGNYRTVIERKTGYNGTWAQIYTTATGVLKYSNIGLSPNTQYFYRVKNYLGPGIMTNSFPAGNTGKDATTLLSGLSVTGTASSNNTIYLTWSGNTGNGDVIIERKMANGGFAVLITLSPSTTAWSDNTGLVPGAVYTYRIKAKNLSNESVYSNEVSVTNTYLNAPTGLTASANTAGGIDLAWNDNSTDESGFEIWRMIYGANNYTLYDTVDKNTVKYTDETVRTGIQYYYMVRAYIRDSSVYSGYTNTVSVGIGMLGAPANLKYSYVSSSQVTLSWTDTASNESGFKVEWKTGEDGNWSVLSWLSANTTSYSVTNLSQYSVYYFRIRAYSYSGNIDSVSSELEVTTALPNAPSDVSAAAVSSSRVNIKWKDNSENESGFRIMRRTSAFNYFTAVGEVGPNVTSYSDSNLYSGITYIYKVVAISAGGSSESREVSATTGKKVTFSDLGSVSWAKEAVENLAGRGIISGKGGNMFKPGDKVTRAEFVAMMIKAFKLETVPVGSLTDVKVGKWYYKDIMTAEYYGIISVDENGRFYPERPITRQEIALIIFKTLEVAGKPLNGYENSVLEKYRDKDLISPYALSSVAYLVGEGIMTGVSSNSLGPHNSATRAEAAVFIFKVIDR